LSYKDAAHRLYLAEVERLKVADSAAKSMTFVKQRMDKVSYELYPPIDSIDAGRFDDYVLIGGKWQKKQNEGGGPSTK